MLQVLQRWKNQEEFWEIWDTIWVFFFFFLTHTVLQQYVMVCSFSKVIDIEFVTMKLMQ